MCERTGSFAKAMEPMPVLYGDPETGLSTPVEESDVRAETVEGLPAALAV